MILKRGNADSECVQASELASMRAVRVTVQLVSDEDDLLFNDRSPFGACPLPVSDRLDLDERNKLITRSLPLLAWEASSLKHVLPV